MTHQYSSKFTETSPSPGGPVYARIAKITENYGFPRSFIFKKLADGTFESKLVVQPGSKRGIRLIYVSSVRRYLAQFDEEGAKV
jgi:hypothetical protein